MRGRCCDGRGKPCPGLLVASRIVGPVAHFVGAVGATVLLAHFGGAVGATVFLAHFVGAVGATVFPAHFVGAVGATVFPAHLDRKSVV